MFIYGCRRMSEIKNHNKSKRIWKKRRANFIIKRELILLFLDIKYREHIALFK